MLVAAYARYSTDRQSDTSLDDQLRNCRSYCKRMGWPEPAVYADAAMSGTRSDRPEYMRLLRDASRFNVILVDDLSRLSRDSLAMGQVLRELQFANVRVIGVSDGTDTGRKGHEAEVGLRGIMSELYIADLADKTHRGLTGKALAGKSAGGLPYGYRVTKTGEREVVPEQAAIVRRIYADYIAGASAQQIAKALNDEGVPTARGKTWAVSAIKCDHARGIGILANPIYKGQQVWNRSKWVKPPNRKKGRVRRENPESEWIVTEQPHLAIVDVVTWDAAKEACKRRSVAGTGGRGRRPRHLLTGLLRCAECGGPLVVVDAYCYGCAAAKDRGTCRSSIRVNRRKAETAMLAGVREILLSDDAAKAWQKAVTRHLREAESSKEAITGRLATARRERDNVMAAIRQGIILPSTKAELVRLEALCATLEREASQPAQMMPDVRGRLRRLADTLADRSAASPAVREALRAVVGEAVVRKENGVTGAWVTPQIAMVAGAGFSPYLSHPVVIPLT